MGKPKTNPKKIPRTQADVDRAYEKGILDGSDLACVIMMSALLDKFNAAEYIPDIWEAFGKLSEEIKEGRVSLPDLRRVLREEYDLTVEEETMEKKRDLVDFFMPRRVRVMNDVLDAKYKKTQECIMLKDENEKLRDMACKQRIALDAMQTGHAKEMAEMAKALKATHAKLAQVEAERDRYKEALRRAFPGKEVQTA